MTITPEALQQRMTARAVAFLQDLLQTAFAKLHTGDTLCEEGIFAPFPRVHIADSTGFGLPESLAKEFPGAGGSGSKRGQRFNWCGSIRVTRLITSPSSPGMSPIVNMWIRWWS